MGRCPRCRMRGVYSDEDGRIVCLLCGHVVSDPEPATLEKMISNETPEATHRVGRRAGPMPADLAARVMAAVRREAGR